MYRNVQLFLLHRRQLMVLTIDHRSVDGPFITKEIIPDVLLTM
jgi:hypothetical protein